MKTKNVFIYLIIAIVSHLLSCYPLQEQPATNKDGVLYGVTEGTFRHRWWNYYERGLSFADGEFWEKAESDFREAIRQRSTDKRRARTYGLHFTDYFPHRELGIVLYKQGKLRDASEELEQSLSKVKSAKAEFYIDLVRKTIVEKEQTDHYPPEIEVTDPYHVSYEKPILTKDFTLKIRGTAKDDTYVRHIQVNNKEIRVDVSEKQIDFYDDVSLTPGKNNIRITAVDLMGKSSDVMLKIIVDNSGPIISIDESQNSFLIRDDSGLEKISVNGKIPENFHKGEKKFVFSDQSSEAIVEAEDIVGNITKILPSHKISKLFAYNTTFSSDMMFAVTDYAIKIEHPSKFERITYQKDVEIRGYILTKDEIKEAFVNDKAIDQIRNAKGKVYFTQRLPLQEDTNNIIAMKCITYGNVSFESESIGIQTKSIEKERTPLKVAVKSFNRIPDKLKKNIIPNFEPMLISFIKEKKRFLAGIIDRDKKDNDCILSGKIDKGKDKIEIDAEMTDIETEDPLLKERFVDVYLDSLKGNISENIIEVIHKKLSDEFPVREGRIIKIDGQKIFINIGSDTEPKIKKGMKILIYKLTPVNDEEEILGLDFSEIAEARILKVESRVSSALLVKVKGDLKDIQKNSPIITR